MEYFSQASEALGHMSGLGLLWTSLSGAYVIKGLYQSVAGSCTEQDFEGRTGILRFTKRPVRRLMLGIGMNTVVVIAAYNSYCLGRSNFCWLQGLMDRLTLPGIVSTDELSTLVGSSMLFTHTLFRLYRSIYINIFSTTSTQDFLDWFAAHSYTLLAGVSLLAEAPALIGNGLGWFDWGSVSWRHVAGPLIFVVASYQDNKLQYQLARFRKNRAGHVVSEDHKLPKGGMFDMVSSPQLLTEIVIHGALALTLGFQHKTWLMCTGYVTISQIVRAVARNSWYKQKYESTFPAGRKAIIPYIL